MTVQVWQSNLTGEKIYTVCEIKSPYYTYIGTEEWPDPPEPGGGGGESTIAWRPSISAGGTISWTRTSSTATPTPVNVKGEKGDTGATGEKGDTGAKGDDGAKGDKGDDGYSPTITVTDIPGGHRVTVTDAEGSESFDVMDGQGGQADSVDWSKVTNKPNFATVATSGSYNDLSNKPTIPPAYDDTAITGRVSAVETALGGHTVGENVPSDAVFTDTVYDDTALSARITANASAIADRYTKTETDAKIAEAMTDVDNEHFHVVTALPPVADAKENHEYVLVTYEQDGTTIATEEHYLFYDGAYHQRTTTVSLDGYATEQYVDNAFTQHVKTDVPVNAVFTDTVYDDTALAARVTANTDAMTNLLSRNYATKGAYNSLMQDYDEILPPDSAANCYRVFMPVAKRNNRNLADYVFEITFNDGTDNILLWVTPSSERPVYGYETYGNLRDGVMYDAKDRDGNLFCYFNEAQYYQGGGATPTEWGFYIIATDKSTSPGGSSEILGNRIAQIEAYEPKTIYNVSEYVNEDFNLAEAATHADVASGVAEAKAYADGKALVTQTGWGIVKCGEVLVSGITSTTSGNVTVDLSEWGFASVNDYDIFVTILQNYSAISARAWVEKQSAASARILAITGQGDAVGVYYVIVAKGYGAVAYTGEIPTGGTAGQVLTKRSDADGDYGWQNKLPSYIADRPEGSSPVSGNVVQVGSFVNTDGVEYGIYEFYYRTSALPAADATKVFPLTPLLDDYTILDFIDATGVTGNGHFIGSGRTDGTNRIIVQQFSKNNKTFTMRAYGDYTQYTALVKIKFIGTKNNA